MLALAEKTGNDVRACLSMLQFYACANKPIRLTDVLKSNVGQKDRKKGLFNIWSSIFQVRAVNLRLHSRTSSPGFIYFEWTSKSSWTAHHFDRMLNGLLVRASERTPSMVKV